MTLSDIGSIASIIGLVIIIVRLVYSKFKALKDEYREFEEMDAMFKNFLIKLVNKSTSSAKRSDVSTILSFHLDNLRHEINQTNFSLLIPLTIFCTLLVVSIHLEQYIFVFLFIILILIELYFFNKTINRQKKLLDETENELNSAWMKHIGKSVKIDIGDKLTNK